jgi:hypothetical protein
MHRVILAIAVLVSPAWAQHSGHEQTSPQPNESRQAADNARVICLLRSGLNWFPITE